jgi:ceramide glucosyltransferase
MGLLAPLAALFALVGLAQTIAGSVLVRRFAAHPRAPATDCPPITILKPLHGDEPLLEEALGSACAQHYPRFQIVFGAHSADDPALAVVERVRRRFPDLDIAVVADSRRHGTNPKVSNLINMFPQARHDLLVIADSDLHVAPDWLERIAAAFEVRGTGLACTLYTGRPATGALAERLAAMQINHSFLPGALLARVLGRQDSLGATMALRRDTLARIGGLEALADHLADDNVLGRLVREQGLTVALADTVPATSVPESRFGAMLRHELRWARTIRALVPAQFAASLLQYPIFWSMLAVALSGGTPWSWPVFATAWVVRMICARTIDRALGLAFRPPLWLLPVREALSVGVVLASYAGMRVDWRGQTLQADDGRARAAKP